MPTESSRTEKYLLIIVTGLVSLAVGVGSGRLLDYFRTQAPRLVYSVTGSESFPGQSQKTGIVLIRFGNAGNREVEDVLFRVSVPGATIQEQRVTGVPNVEQMMKGGPNAVELRLPFLNPSEQVSVHLLLGLNTPELSTPTVELRAKGVVGVPDNVAEAATRSPLSEFATLGIGVSAALLTTLALGMQLPRRWGARAANTFGDDQRDVVAYILDAQGLSSDAQTLRVSARELTYWAIADQLTAKWLASGDAETVKKGCRALGQLLQYADMASGSCDIIKLHMARLFVAHGDDEEALKQIATIRHRNSPIIKTRVSNDSGLSQLMSKSSPT
jgi:hypothetical protein